MTAVPVPEPDPRRTRRPTVTARFGSSRRESHDASAFYGRFTAPKVSDDTAVCEPTGRDVIHHGDARDMRGVATSSVALVVTSPPYFAGKEYEESLGHDGVPATYVEYLTRVPTGPSTTWWSCWILPATIGSGPSPSTLPGANRHHGDVRA